MNYKELIIAIETTLSELRTQYNEILTSSDERAVRVY